MPVRNNVEEERRRSARFSCDGHATITRLPSSGIFLPGKILDRSLGGCHVDAGFPIDCGVRAEIVARVSAGSFPAVGEVRAIRGRSGVCIEFVRLAVAEKTLGNRLRFPRKLLTAESLGDSSGSPVASAG